MIRARLMILGLGGTVALLAYLLASCSQPPLNCATIHMPKAGCPEGFQRTDKLMKDARGAVVPMCYSEAPHLAECVDVIYPGERLQFFVRFH